MVKRARHALSSSTETSARSGFVGLQDSVRVSELLASLLSVMMLALSNQKWFHRGSPK
jgi:hypothetical protein